MTVQPTATTPTQVLLRMMRKGGWWYVFNLSTIVAVLLIELLPGFINREILNNLQGNQLTSIPWLLLGALVGITAARMALFVLLTYTNPKTRIASENAMRKSLLARIFQQPAVSALKGSPGEIVSRFRDDIGEMPHTVLHLNDIIALSLFAVVAFYTMYQIAPSATLVIMLPLVLIVAGARVTYDRIYVYRQERRRATGRVVGFIAETFGAIQAVQVAGTERHVLRHFAELNKVREVATLREVLFDGLLSSLFRNAVDIGIAVMMLMLHQQAVGGEFRAGDVAFFVYSLGAISELLGELGIFIGRQQQMRVSVQRLENIGHGLPADQLFDDKPFPAIKALPPLQTLAIRHLSVQWKNDGYGVKDVSLDLAPGRLVVVTGVVGAGKTTLLRGILGMLPRVTGEMYWNNTLIDDPDLQLVPPAVAYTSQVPRLFSDTVEDNITQGRHMSSTELDTAIHGAVFEYDVAQFEHGIATLVGSRGVRLSGGQIQRAAFARMLYERPQVWLIDDVSSALDIVTEQLLWQRFSEIRSQVACLIVTHRPQVMAMADEIIVMKDGCVQARGTYTELMSSGQLTH
ncbi:MAG: ATP-binding cassette domain-containing protein [Roseiflexaceae bacterium]|jgi:ATP-binding cassette subfamily B protein|nr:ABC transporter ATP-binding protein/permease [Chloroflexaceae bacterium]MCE2851483.1 ABC transporter ATP-binding protein/permease [Chloroflexaceae bacterium]